MSVYVSAEMREVMEQMHAGWVLCVRDYKAWREFGEQHESVSPVVVGQLLSAGLVSFVDQGAEREYRYELTDVGRAALTAQTREVE